METRGRIVLAVLLLLAGAFAAVLVEQGLPRPRQEARGEAFQRLVGGLGFGPAVDLSECAFGFDPRLDGACTAECGPIPGGGDYCPRHAASIFTYRPLDNGKPFATGDSLDATPP